MPAGDEESASFSYGHCSATRVHLMLSIASIRARSAFPYIHQVINAFERDLVTRMPRRHHGNITKAAEEMDTRQQLQQKIRELGIQGWEES